MDKINPHWDYSKQAKYYEYRPNYSPKAIDFLVWWVSEQGKKKDFKVADLGAGTGNLTILLLNRGLFVYAVEPNDAMREEGILYTKDFSNITWLKGSGEDTNVKTNIADWVIMASSFHWTNPDKSLPEFARILKDDGYFTAIWNPRNIKISKFHTKIEENIKKIVPELKRVSSGAKENTKEWEYIITSTGDFKDCIFMETDYEEIMNKERYIGVWESVNDIRVQAGEERWQQLMDMIKKEIKDLKYIKTPYKIRAWTAKKI